MLLLLGGTSDCAPLAEAVAKAGYRVLVSSATDVELFTGAHPRLERRSGRLGAEEMVELIRVRRIEAVIDATHPYAVLVRETARQASSQAGIPYLSYMRPGILSEEAGVRIVGDHDEAARVSVQAGKPVLLTIGSRHVLPYAREAERVGIDVIARVLDHPESHQSCREAGIPSEHVIVARGPFSVEENRRLIRQFHAGVLVTKDSGDAGGVREKIEAARLEDCAVIVVGRPQTSVEGEFQEIPGLIEKLKSVANVPPCSVLALDLESVLVPEIWETVARETGLAELARTTRDIPDYGVLMRRRISLCREHGLTLVRLREVVAGIEPLPGALAFLAWAQKRALVVIVSDTFHELAGPMMQKLGSPMMLCHSLVFDEDGYISDYSLSDFGGKAGAIARFQRLGWRVAAVGDSFNDLEMLKAADVACLFCPSPSVLEAGVAFPSFPTFDNLQSTLAKSLL